MVFVSLVVLRLFVFFFFFSSRRRHTRFDCDWSSDVCSSDLGIEILHSLSHRRARGRRGELVRQHRARVHCMGDGGGDRKSTRLNSSHSQISYAVFCLKKKKNQQKQSKPNAAVQQHAHRASHH